MSQGTKDSVAKPSWIPKAIGLVAVLIIGAIVAMTQGKKSLAPVAGVNDLETDAAVSETKPEPAPAPTTSVPAAEPAATKPVQTKAPAPIEVRPVVTAVPAGVALVAATYKNGIYSTTGNYASPAGPESIDVTLTVAGDVVTAASVKANATNPVSSKFQAKFVDGYASVVVGKKLADLSLSKVSGASLTTNGFNEALEELKTQATV